MITWPYSAPNELQHAALSGTAPTLKPVGLQWRHYSNPVWKDEGWREPCRDVANKLPTDGPPATQMIEACLRCSWHVNAHRELSVDHYSKVTNDGHWFDIDGADANAAAGRWDGGVSRVVGYYVTEGVCKLWDSLMSPHASVPATDQSQR